MDKYCADTFVIVSELIMIQLSVESHALLVHPTACV